MSKKLFSRPLGDCMSPFGFQQKNIAPALAAMFPGVGAAVSGLFSGISNLFSSKSTNKSNERINRENNQFNAEQAQLNRDWEQKMWNMENQYNTPSAQRQRMEQAGINPFVDQSPVSAGGASGVPTGASAQAAPPLAMQRPDLSGFGDIFKNLMTLRSVTAESGNQDAQRFNEFAKAIPDLLKVYNSDQVKKMGEQILGSSPSYFNFYERQMNATILKQEAESEMAQMQNMLLDKFGYAEGDARLREANARADSYLSQVDLNKASVELKRAEIPTMAAKLVEIAANAYKLRKEGDKYAADASTINSIREWVVGLAKYQAGNAQMEYMSNNALFQGNEYYRHWLKSEEGKEQMAQYGKWQTDSHIQWQWASDILSDYIPSFFVPIGGVNLNSSPTKVSGFKP